MSDWEDELDNEEQKKESENEIKKVEESEEIIQKETDYKAPVQTKQNEKDYEKIYGEKKKGTIEITRKVEEAVKNIKDPELRLKKKLELLQMYQANQFLGIENEQDKSPGETPKFVYEKTELKVDKDFKELARKIAANINKAKQPSQFTLSFLKNSIEFLAPSLDSVQISDFMKALTIVYNNKSKEESAGKKAQKKQNTAAGGDLRKKMLEDYGGRGEDHHEEEDDDDDFI